MQASTKKGSSPSTARHFELLLNFCRTVLRSDDELLRSAMDDYEQFLAHQQSS